MEGGFSEPLSRAQFPANREINREFCKFGGRICAPDPAITRNLRQLPSGVPIILRKEQGIIATVSGNYHPHIRE